MITRKITIRVSADTEEEFKRLAKKCIDEACGGSLWQRSDYGDGQEATYSLEDATLMKKHIGKNIILKGDMFNDVLIIEKVVHLEDCIGYLVLDADGIYSTVKLEDIQFL